MIKIETLEDFFKAFEDMANQLKTINQRLHILDSRVEYIRSLVGPAHSGVWPTSKAPGKYTVEYK